jgi:predicted MFS family arabinose efflux permease
MRQLGIVDLLVVLGVTVLLWLGRYLLPEQEPNSLGRDARQVWMLPRRPLFWAVVGLLALVAGVLATTHVTLQ